MKINQIWNELSDDKTFTKGLLLRRYSGEILPDVYIAIQNPEKLLCICTSINKCLEIDILDFSNLQEIQVDIFPSPNEYDKNVLVFKLLNFQHRDIFAVLCEDLISCIATEINERKIVKEILNRFEKWKTLFSKMAMPGLCPEEQRGLFGELYFLRKFLKINTNHSAVITSWVGAEKEAQDFQNHSWGVEIKTTCGKTPQKILISNERQLDTNHLDNLFLYHIALEPLQNSGETLNMIVDSIEEILKTEMILLNKFRNKLYEAGYFESQRNLYNDIGYIVRYDNYYEVENDFPRIEEKDIRNGVRDVKYSITIPQCSPFEITEIDVFTRIRF